MRAFGRDKRDGAMRLTHGAAGESARTQLLAGCRGMKEREASIEANGRARIPQALERLVMLYEATGNTTEAAAWRAELEAVRLRQPGPPRSRE